MTPHEVILEVLATPREAGTAGAERARHIVRAYLEELGYRVELQGFRFSPSVLRAFPLLGAGLAWLTLLLLPLLGSPRVANWSPLALWTIGLIGLGLLAVGRGTGWAPSGGRLREDANLVAVRGDRPVRRWIVAHLDTKAQGHSMAGRLIAVWMLVLGVSFLSVVTIWRLRGAVPLPVLAATAALSLTAGGLAARGKLRGTSPGARDNGSGVVAALAAAASLTDASVGILITGAEEFGLVGSRVFARANRDRLADVEIVNLDTLDDVGSLYLVFHDARGRDLAQREETRLRSLGLPIRLRRLPLGILVDSLPLARAGAPSFTISRLDWHTLRVMHTPRDTCNGLELNTAMGLGKLIAQQDVPGPAASRAFDLSCRLG